MMQNYKSIFCDMRMAPVSYCRSLIIIVYVHTYVYMYICSFGHCMYRGIQLPAYGYIGACISNLSGTDLLIKLDAYNTAYLSCETWTLLIFFSILKLNSPEILILY